MTVRLPEPTLSYDVVDVFTDVAFAGNPLAVVHGSAGLSTDQLQAVADEFNLSETAFPTAPTEPGADYQLRIFTASRELPFAGHPSIGAAWVLHSRGELPAGRRVQQCGAGPVTVSVAADGPVALGSDHLEVGGAIDPVPAAAALGLTPDDLDPVARPGLASAGLPFGYLLLRPGGLGRITLDGAAVGRLRDAAGRPVEQVFAGELDHTDGTLLVRARVFVPVGGPGEDPATGSAALGLGVHLAARGLVGDGSTAYTVRQGAEMGRPSTLTCRVTAADGVARLVEVSGRVVPVASGRIRVPAPR